MRLKGFSYSTFACLDVRSTPEANISAASEGQCNYANFLMGLIKFLAICGSMAHRNWQN